MEDEDGGEEALSVLDLPQLYQKPASEDLLAVLNDLALAPPSWDTALTQTPSKRQISEEGVPAYLTKIISSPLKWIQSEITKEEIWELASQRLSERSGRTGRGDLTRTFTIPTIISSNLDEEAVEIALHEPALQSDNLGLKTWGSAYLLSKRLSTLSTTLPPLKAGDRVLELGSGTGLLGLAAAAIFKAPVVLTDLPEIVPNLRRNCDTNLTAISARGGDPEVEVLDWTNPSSFPLAETSNSFPLILAADPIYSPVHPGLLAQTIEYHLSRDERARVVIELPLREAYGPERQDLRNRLCGIGLALLDEGEDIGFDDWAQGNERVELRCWWGIWGRK